MTYYRDRQGRPGLYVDVVGPNGQPFPRKAQPEDINRDPELYTKTDVPGFVSELERQAHAARVAEADQDYAVTFLTGESERHLEEQLARVQETLDAMLRRLPPEELEALLVAVRG